MENRMQIFGFWRIMLVAAVIVVVLPALHGSEVRAQEGGNRPYGGDREGRPDRGDRGGRGGRGNFRGGNGGDRGGRGPGGERGRDRNDRPAPASTPPSTSAPAATSASATATPSSTNFGIVPDSERIRKMASDQIEKNDKNGNGILEGDELNNLGMSRNADKDGDGKITHNELVAFYTPKSASNSTPPAATKPSPSPPAKSTSGGATSSDGGTDSLVIVDTSRKSYRFKSTKDRQSSWKFSSKDANGDGQVSMSEYASSWNDRTAAEFERYDKDNDGMITAAEAK
jgi:EF hand